MPVIVISPAPANSALQLSADVKELRLLASLAAALILARLQLS
jgi:hypothetical protein